MLLSLLYHYCLVYYFCTMCRYYLRFMDPNNSEELVNKEKERSVVYRHSIHNCQSFLLKKHACSKSIAILLWAHELTSGRYDYADIGAQLMYMLVVLSMQSFTYFMRGFGTRFSFSKFKLFWFMTLRFGVLEFCSALTTYFYF